MTRENFKRAAEISDLIDQLEELDGRLKRIEDHAIANKEDEFQVIITLENYPSSLSLNGEMIPFTGRDFIRQIRGNILSKVESHRKEFSNL